MALFIKFNLSSTYIGSSVTTDCPQTFQLSWENIHNGDPLALTLQYILPSSQATWFNLQFDGRSNVAFMSCGRSLY